MLIVLTLMACSGDDSDVGDTDVPLGDFGQVDLSPANDALDVPLDTDIIAQFDKDLRMGDIGIVGRASVSGIDGNTLTAVLSEPLDLLTSYTLQTLGVTSIDGDEYGNVQTTFTSRDGVWGDAQSVGDPNTLISNASAVLGDSLLVLTARAERTALIAFTNGTQGQPVLLDDGVEPDNTWLVANGERAVAMWTQDADLYTSSSSVDGPWSDAQLLSESSFLQQAPTGLALTDDGTVAVAWRASSGRTQVANRVDGEWSPPLNLGCASQSECSSVHLHADHTGAISALILGHTADGQRMETSGFRSDEWTTPEVLFSVDGDVQEPVVAVQPDETLAMWRVTDSVDAGLFMSRLSDDGTWSDPLQVRDNVDITTLDMVARADGGWTAAWVEYQSDNDEDTYNLWVSGVEATALTDPFRLIDSTTPLGDVNLAADAGGNLHLTCRELGEPARLLTRRFNHRTGWDDAVELATATGPAKVLVLPDNRGHAVFIDHDQLTTTPFE